MMLLLLLDHLPTLIMLRFVQQQSTSLSLLLCCSCFVESQSRLDLFFAVSICLCWRGSNLQTGLKFLFRTLNIFAIHCVKLCFGSRSLLARSHFEVTGFFSMLSKRSSLGCCCHHWMHVRLSLGVVRILHLHHHHHHLLIEHLLIVEHLLWVLVWRCMHLRVLR